VRLSALRLAMLGGLVANVGCQSFGAFSTPRTLSAGEVRVGASVGYNDFSVSGERQQASDFEVVCQVGVTDKNELDFLAYEGGVDARVKHDFLGDGKFDLSLSSGLGLFSTFQANESSIYIPLDLVGGYRVTDDITLFAGPKLYGALSLNPPGVGAGFNNSTVGLLGGGVLGVAMESKRLTFIPQITWMTPIATGGSGTVVQIVLGMATDFR
jgi:hypothetical protein